MGGVNHEPLKIPCNFSIMNIDYSYIVYLFALALTIGMCSMVEMPNLINDKIQE